VNTNSAAEFGNKVQSCGTEDAKIFYCYRLEPVLLLLLFFRISQVVKILGVKIIIIIIIDAEIVVLP